MISDKCRRSAIGHRHRQTYAYALENTQVLFFPSGEFSPMRQANLFFMDCLERIEIFVTLKLDKTKFYIGGINCEKYDDTSKLRTKIQWLKRLDIKP